MSTILLIEDEPALLESYCELVTSLGHECVPAHDGAGAIDLARRSAPDLVVTDYMVPGLNGAEIIEALAADPALARVPVILLSAGRPPEAASQKAWLFLPKPLSLDRFERAIEEGLRAGAAARGPQVLRAAPPEVPSDETLLREQMLSWVAHEIKSPLSAALMASQLALRHVQGGEDPAASERRLRTIIRQLTRMDELVSSILDAAQLQEGRLRIEPEPIELGDLLQQAISFWKDLHPDYQLELHDGHDVLVSADRERLREILDNLLSNAIKYGGADRTVRITVRTTDAEVAVSVKDRGRGIPAEEIPHIFDRFHRVAGQGGRGHGLGLYIAAALARLHGGALSVESTLGEGSTFTLTLPRNPSGGQAAQA